MAEVEQLSRDSFTIILNNQEVAELEERADRENREWEDTFAGIIQATLGSYPKTNKEA